MAGAAVELIRQVPLFSDLDDRELKAVAGSMKERAFAAGGGVLEEGTGGVGFFVIESGSARVSAGGRQVRTLGPGDHFGEIALIGDVDRTATVTAETDLRCYAMTAWDFKPLVASNASIAWKLLQTLARQLSEAQQARG